MIRHIVLLRARSGITAAEIDSVFAEIGRLRDVLPGFTGFAAGESLQLEQRERGYLHGFIIDFADRAALDAYQADPGHHRAGERLVGLAEGGVDGLLVFDLPA